MRKKKAKSLRVKKKNTKITNPCLIRARNLRASLLRRVSQKLKQSTPTIEELYKWLNIDEYKCYYSNEILTIDNLTIDHKIPLSRGGTNELNNLCICSRKMNTIKGQLTEEEFNELLELVSKWEDGGESLFRRIRQGFFG